MFEKNLEINYLLDFYGEVLNDRRRTVLEMYYNDDYSLSEIAADIGISRQGVRDSIKKAERELAFFEERLGLVARENAVREAGERLLSLLPKGSAAEAAARALLVAAGDDEG